MADETEGAAPEEKGFFASVKDMIDSDHDGSISAGEAYTTMTDWNGDGKTTTPELIGSVASLFVGGPALKVGATVAVNSVKFVATKVVAKGAVKGFELASGAVGDTARLAVNVVKDPTAIKAGLIGTVGGAVLSSGSGSPVSDASAETLPATSIEPQSAAKDTQEKIVDKSTAQPAPVESQKTEEKGTVTEDSKSDKVAFGKEAFGAMLNAAGYKDGEQLKKRLNTAKDEDLSEKDGGKIEVSAKTQEWLVKASEARIKNTEAQHLLKELGAVLKFGEDGKAYDGGETVAALEKAKQQYGIKANSVVVDIDGKDADANSVSSEMLDGLRAEVAKHKKAKVASK